MILSYMVVFYQTLQLVGIESTRPKQQAGFVSVITVGDRKLCIICQRKPRKRTEPKKKGAMKDEKVF